MEKMGTAESCQVGKMTQTGSSSETEMVIHDCLVVPHLQATSYVEVISALAHRLVKCGYVTEGFLEAVLQRETSMPTGLPLADIPVAIPHAEAQYCIVPAIAVGILDQPVEFGEMGGYPGSTLPVQIVFLLAINDPNQQVKWLQRLVLLFQTPALLKELKSLPNAKQIARFLQWNLLQKSPDAQPCFIDEGNG